jgi:glycine hydroxymethyltransferase
MNNIAGAAITFRKAMEPAFRDYAFATLRNAKTLAEALSDEGVALVTGGTDNHLIVADTMQSFGLDGRAAERALDAVGITVNKQVIPDDPRPPLRPSGIRLGTPACTTRGMNEDDMRQIAKWMSETLRDPDDRSALERRRAEVTAFCRSYPIPGLAEHGRRRGR